MKSSVFMILLLLTSAHAQQEDSKRPRTGDIAVLCVHNYNKGVVQAASELNTKLNEPSITVPSNDGPITIQKPFEVSAPNTSVSLNPRTGYNEYVVCVTITKKM